MSVTARPALVIGVLAACAWTAKRDVAAPAPATTSAAPLTFRPVVAPFPVSDSTGRLLEMGFLGGFNNPRPQLVDADGDGDLDLFVQEVNSKIGYYERDGERDGLPHFVFKTDKYGDIDAGQWYRFADVDGDGDLDLLTEQPFSYIKYYRNDGAKGGALHFSVGADTLRDPNGKPIFADAQNIPQLGDLDCNKRADLLIGRVDGTVSRYEATANTASGAAGAPVFELVANEFEGIKIIGKGQIGGDGGLLQPTTPSAPKSGGPSAPEPTNVRKHGANTMALSDIDNDGDLDLFWGDYFEPGLLLIPNTGSCQTPNFRNTPINFPEPAPLATSGYNAPAFGDVNGDKRADLVVGVLGGAYNPLQTSVGNLLYMERGTSDAWTIRTRQLLPAMDVGSESIPALVDLDGDGDLDLLLANKIDPASLKTSRIYWYENTGSKTKPELKQRGTLTVPGRDRYHVAPTFGDLDGDGRLDLVLGEWGPQVGWYHLGANRQLTLVDSALITITRGSNTTPTLGDLDGDGDLDLFVGEASGYINYYRNDGTRTKPKFTLVSDEFENIKFRRSAPHLADIDKDGDLDLLIGTESNGLVLYRNNGTRTAPKFERDSTFAPPVQGTSAPVAGDLDGDGDLDLMVGTVGGGAVYLEQQ